MATEKKNMPSSSVHASGTRHPTWPSDSFLGVEPIIPAALALRQILAEQGKTGHRPCSTTKSKVCSVEFEENVPEEEEEKGSSVHNHEAADGIELEIIRAQKLYGQLSNSLQFEIREMAKLFMEIITKNRTDTISLEELEQVFVDMQFLSQGQEDTPELLRKTYALLHQNLALAVFIGEAKNLISMDDNGLSDPFCEVRVDNKIVGKTTVKYETLNPVWEEQLHPCQVPLSSKKLTVVVCDSDAEGVAGHANGHDLKQYMGSVDIDLSSVMPGQGSWYKLELDRNLCHKAMQVTGEILLHVETSHTKKTEGTQNQKVSLADAIGIFCRIAGKRSESLSFDSRGCWPLDPDSYTKQAWDFLVLLFLLFSTFSVPYLLAFGKDLSEIDTSAPLTGYDIWDVVMDALFCFDIVLSFCTAYVYKGVYMTRFSSIAHNYLSGWFWIDMPGSIPFDKLVIYLSSPENRSNVGPILKVLKFIRILKMARAVKFMKKMHDLQEIDRTGSLRTFFKIFRMLFLIIFLSHFLGCMFVLLRDNNSPDTLNNWMDAYDPEIRYADATVQYWLCLYWALSTISTIGYGDVPPVNNLERQFTIGVVLIGVVAFSFAVSNLNVLMSEDKGIRRKFEAQIKLVEDYLEFRDVKSDLKRRLLSHFHGCFRQSGGAFDEVNILNSVPPNLKRLACTNLALMAEARVPMLKGLEIEAMAMIFSMLMPMHFCEDEHIYKLYDLGGSMFFITVGVVLLDGCYMQRIDQPHEFAQARKVGRESAEACFGQISLFQEVCKVRPEDAIAQCNVQTLCLTREILERVRVFCPEFYDRLFDFCLLSSSLYGVTNESIGSRGRPARVSKIEQICIDMRKKLMARHEVILMDKVLEEKLSDHSLSNTRSTSQFSGVVFKRGQLNRAYRERFFVLKDEVLEYFEDRKAYLTQNRGDLVLSRHARLKGFISTKNIKVTPATPEGVQKSNDGYHFTMTTEAGRKMDCACESAAERDLWVHMLLKTQSTDGTEVNDSISKNFAKLHIKKCEILMCSRGTFAQELPLADKDSLEMWKGCMFTVTQALEVWYSVDEIGTLIESMPKCMGTLVTDRQDFQKTCRVWRQSISRSKMAFGNEFGCVFMVCNGPDCENKSIYIGCQSKREANVIRNFILQVASRHVFLAEAEVKTVKRSVPPPGSPTVPACEVTRHLQSSLSMTLEMLSMARESGQLAYVAEVLAPLQSSQKRISEALRTYVHILAEAAVLPGYHVSQGNEKDLPAKEISHAPGMVRMKAEKLLVKDENLGKEDLELSRATDQKTTMDVFCAPETRPVSKAENLRHEGSTQVQVLPSNDTLAFLTSAEDFMASGTFAAPLISTTTPSSDSTTSRALLKDRDTARVPVTPEANTPDQTRAGWRIQPKRSMAPETDAMSRLGVLNEMYELIKKQNSIAESAERDIISLLETTPLHPSAGEQSWRSPASDGPSVVRQRQDKTVGVSTNDLLLRIRAERTMEHDVDTSIGLRYR